MLYRIEGKKINLDRMNSLSTFENGDIYNYRKFLIRVYKENIPDELDIRYLSKIKSINIYLPIKLLYGNDKFMGYTIKSNKKYDVDKMINTPKDELLDAIYDLEEEIDNISQKKVILTGLDRNDAYYNGELFIINPDKYIIYNGADEDSIKDVNNLEISSLINKMLIHELNGENITKKNISLFNELLNKKDLFTRSSDYLDELLDDNHNVKEFVKKL